MFEDYSPAEKQVYQYIEWCQFVANFTEATVRIVGVLLKK